MGKEPLPVFSVSPTMLSITATHISFYLILLVPLAATLSFDLPNFDREIVVTCSPNRKGICLQGDAFLNRGLQLTKNQLHTSIASSVGRAVYSQPMHLWDSATGRMADFATHFSFIIHDVDPWSPSGDGFAFFLSSYPSVMPENSAGGFLGLFPNSSDSSGLGNLVAIEFDTYPNSGLDTAASDHIGININSIRSVMHLTLNGGIKKRITAEAWVRYDTSKQSLSVAFTCDDVSREGGSNLSHVVDLREVLPEYVSIGFSAATGSFVETHTILSWSFDSSAIVRGNVAARLLVFTAVMAGVLLVVAVLTGLSMWRWRKIVARGVANNNTHVVALLEKNGKKNDESIDVGPEHINETIEAEEVTSVDTKTTAESVQGLLKGKDTSLDDMYLVEAKKCQDGRLTKQYVLQEADICLGAEYTDENAHGKCESEKATEIVQLSDETEGLKESEVITSDAGEVKEGGGSHVEAPIPADSLDSWSPKEIPYNVLVTATSNFSEEMMLGKGGFGPVYRGFLSDLGLDVAIKKLSERSEQGLSEYVSEVRIITQLRHRNLVKLIGWCHEHGQLMLVYEFMPHGSLDNHLFEENSLLEWSVRYKIVLGLANALTYLHDECEPYVLHRDVKSSNVLLDSKFDAKLADFGLARLFNLEISSLRVTHPAGTRGYWAPEYALISRASKRSDVYSFGVVVLEIACGKKAILITEEEDGESNAMLLVEWVWHLYGKGAILDAADKKLTGHFDKLQMERMLMVGLWCAHPDHLKRPSMRQASNALLFPETTPLPNLPTEVPPWAYPLVSVHMQVAQLSPTPLSSVTSGFSSSVDSMFPPRNKKRGNTSNTLPKQVMSKKTKPWLFPRFTWWWKRRQDDDRISTVGGLKEFTYKELVQATDDFSPRKRLGGPFSPVYEGQLSSGMVVSVNSFQEYYGSRDWTTEVITLSLLEHKNLVELIGWCHERGQYSVVFEHMPNGSLDRHLFGDLADGTIPWEVRYKVAHSLASVLCYLHNDCEWCVLHRDIKPGNMWLDEEFNMKLGGFAVARQTYHGTSLQSSNFISMCSSGGRSGYLAPEYCLSGNYTRASDVYSFGVVALEIACGRMNLELYTTEEYGSLMEWVWRCSANGDLLAASDKKLMGIFDRREMERLIMVGLCCTHIDPAQRPEMVTVLRVLQFEEELPFPVLAEGCIPTMSFGMSHAPVSSARDSDACSDGD